MTINDENDLRMQTPPTLTVLLVSYNTKALIDPCLAALDAARAHIDTSEVVIVDNASRDGSAEHVEEHHPDVKLIRSSQNLGFGRANNLALAGMDSPRLLLLNTDAFVAEDSIAKAMAYMDANPRCGILGVRLVGRDGEVQPSCRYFPTPLNVFLARVGLARWFPRVRMIDGPQWAPAETQECDWVPGCFYLVRREVVAAVGLFDPRYFLYYEEVDHCLAAQRAGWQVVYLSSTTVVHIGGESAKADSEITQAGRQVDRISMESAMLYFRKNRGRSGLLAHVALELLGDAYVGMKALVKQRDTAVATQMRKRMAATFELLRITSMGTRATR
jgi:N-acetylglucosaminyl-diphospho-decaprenol L-rhamnosyltransferase